MTVAATYGCGGNGSVDVDSLVASLERRPLPVGNLSRILALGGLQVELTADYLTTWIGGLFRDREARERRMAQTHVEAAVKVLGGMGYLRGLAMKLGQALASYPKVLPAAYAEVLGRLNFEAPPMHFSLVRELFVDDLGAEPEDLFAEFDRRAFAAASLGQVHRARLRTGEEVAVKIQYPGIATTLRTDFRNLRALLLPIRFSSYWELIRLSLEDVLKVLMAETDYRQEADFQRRAATTLTGLEGVRVPRVFPEYTTQRVLTTELLRGRHADAYLRTNPPQEERDAFGERLLRAVSRLVHSGRIVYADPNPGNFLFCDDGTLGLLDFGAMRPLDEREFDFNQRGHDMILFHPNALRERALALESMGVPPDTVIGDAHAALLAEWTEWFVAPYVKDETFHFSEGYWARFLDLMGRSLAAGGGPSLPHLAHQARMAIGLVALFTRLGARFNGHRIQKEELLRVSTLEAPA